MKMKSRLRSEPRYPARLPPEKLSAEDRVYARRPPISPLGLIWGAWLSVILALALAHISIEEPTLLAEMLLIMHSAGAVAVLVKSSGRAVGGILAVSLILRTVIVFWDLNFSSLFTLPNSGVDSEVYYSWAVQVSENPHLIFEDIRGGVFSKICGIVFWLIGPVRAVVQYTNALLGLSSIVLIMHAMEYLPLTRKRRIRVLTVAALLPNALVLSSIFLRESLVSFLVAVSVYHFIRWFNSGRVFNVIGALAPIVAGASLHAGIIGVGVGYAVVILFYRPKTAKFGWSVQSFAYFGLLFVVIYLVAHQYPDVFLGKFQNYGSEAELVEATNRRSGGSQYLTGLVVTGYLDLLRFGPLRGVYFLGSPMPWDIRGVMDLLTFALDSVFYLGVPILALLRLPRLNERERALAIALLVVLAVATLVFGAGVGNSGTATRHRFKLLAILMALLGICETALVKARQSGVKRKRARV